MIVGAPKETLRDERRVALVPGVIPSLTKAGLEVLVETGAGSAAGFVDRAYADKGATIVSSRGELFTRADVIVQVRGDRENQGSGHGDLSQLRSGQALIGLLDPLGSPDVVRELAKRGVTAFAMELIPRLAKAQVMDALSSQATIAGYKAVLLAAGHLPRVFPMMMTAAGTLSPARVFVLGVGVAGLQAIATARRLGALVEAYDIRPSVKEQVESVGGTFVQLPVDAGAAEDRGGYATVQDESFYRRQRELLTRVVTASDVVITTAAVPGKKAPILVTREMVKGMQPGSVIVDLAAERGGNCEATRPDQVVETDAVTILGPTNLPATVPHHASQMYAKNVSTFLLHLVKEGRLHLDTTDEITRETMVTRDGQVVHERMQ